MLDIVVVVVVLSGVCRLPKKKEKCKKDNENGILLQECQQVCSSIAKIYPAGHGLRFMPIKTSYSVSFPYSILVFQIDGF